MRPSQATSPEQESDGICDDEDSQPQPSTLNRMKRGGWRQSALRQRRKALRSNGSEWRSWMMGCVTMMTTFDEGGCFCLLTTGSTFDDAGCV